jgi:hypothetical protein
LLEEIKLSEDEDSYELIESKTEITSSNTKGKAVNDLKLHKRNEFDLTRQEDVLLKLQL